MTTTRTTNEKADSSVPTNTALDNLKKSLNAAPEDKVPLPQCYMCAKKHLSRAQIYFEELHTGYDDRIKLLMHSMRVAEAEVRKAFSLYYKAQAHMDMSAGELLGSDPGASISSEHVKVANDIRSERLKLQDDPLYVPDFDRLLLDIQLLQYSE